MRNCVSTREAAVGQLINARFPCHSSCVGPSLGRFVCIRRDRRGTGARERDGGIAAAGARHLAIAAGEVSDEKAKLVDAAVAVRRSVVLLCDSNGPRGTGFVLSRTHRLIATAAHVADVLGETGSASAVLEGSSLVRRVERVWYHPRLKRDFDFGLSATSFDARDGPISPDGPDLAIVQLAEGGEGLPDGCDAKLDEDSTLAQGRAVGVIGYWGDESSAWPTAGRPAKANFATSAVGPAYALAHVWGGRVVVAIAARKFGYFLRAFLHPPPLFLGWRSDIILSVFLKSPQVLA